MATPTPGRTEPNNLAIEVVHRTDENDENRSVDRPPPIVEPENIDRVTAAAEPLAKPETVPNLRSEPEPLMPPGTSIDVATDPTPNWRMPLYARYRLLSLGAGLLSVVWLVASVMYVLEGLGLSDLFALLPHEIGGMAAGVVTPLALL